MNIKKIIILIIAVMMILPGSSCTKIDDIIKTKNSQFSFLADSKTDEIKNKNSNEDYIELYVESSVCYVNGKEKQIDKNNQNVVPYLKNGNVYIPVGFVTTTFGTTNKWDNKTKTSVITDKNGNIFNIPANSNIISANIKNKKSEIDMGAKSELIDGCLYAPAAAIAEILGKSLFYERGLIIIVNEKYLPDSIKDKDKIDSSIEKFTGIKNIGSQEKLFELLGYDPNNRQNIYYDGWVDYDMGIPENAEAAPAAVPAPTMEAAAEEKLEKDSPAAPETSGPDDAAGNADFSETNTQVQGVDEADIIKTDGQYIYYVRNQVIEIVKTNNDGIFEFMSSFKLTDKNNFSFSDIFIDGNKIIAIGTYYTPPEYGNDNNYRYYYSSENYTKAVVINAENKKSPKFERSVEVKGNYITSRKIGNSVYFAANQYFWNYYGSDENGIMPLYCDTAESDEMLEIGYDRLYCFPIIHDQSMTTLVGFNIDRSEEEACIETFLGSGNNIYMSEKAMYIAGVNYNGKNGSETIINKFAVDDGKLVFVKSGTAPGYILNQFSMDEYKSYFRIVTNVSEYKNNNYKEYNGLYIFDNTMEIVGRIDDIAPGEYIYSARFMGNRAFMVTFRTVDPLFAIDLSNPKNPVVMGALKIPGYSNYLHPYDENHLIGFGKDTVVDSYGGAYYTGMKISLFDVTDITNPVEMFVETIGDRGTDSELLYNHKALLFSKDKNLLAFPVTVYESNEKPANGKMPAYGTFAFSGAYIYDIDLTDGFNLRGKISHMSAQDMLKASDWGGNSDLYINRLLTIRDNLYAASNAKLSSHNLTTLDKIDEFIFDK